MRGLWRVVVFCSVIVLIAAGSVQCQVDSSKQRASVGTMLTTLLNSSQSSQSARPAQSTTQTSESPQTGVRAGAVMQITEAERIRELEAQVQSQLLDVARTVERLEQQLGEMRKLLDSPPRWEIERFEQDLNLVNQELSRISATQLSPLTELQRNDLRDRVFDLQVALEVAKRRWGGTWSIFGMDFFTTAAPVSTIEQRAAPANYRVKVGDKLRVTVTSNLGQATEYQPIVNPSGNIHIPGAGSVRAAGRTCDELRRDISAKISGRFKQLRVDVILESLASILVQVAGDVARPGTYMLSGIPTVLSALCQAGGPTKSGTFRKISVVREGEPRRVVDLYSFLLKGDKSQDVLLKDGDLIFVPPVGPTIIVEGEVVRPARYEPDFPITLAGALEMAGGVKPSGYSQNVQVERIENGAYRVLLNEPLSGARGSGFRLQPGDVVTVASVKPDRTNQVTVDGPVRAPGMYGYSKGMRVADLIKLAQGLDPAKEVFGGRADILRTDPLKGTEIVTINLERALAGDPEHNIELEKLDRLFLYEPDQIMFRPRLVTVQGAVAQPGVYKRTEKMRVADAIAAAGGLLPEAYVERADIIRHAPDGTSELIRVDLDRAMAGDPIANVLLHDRDEITIYTHSDVRWADRTVRIEGAVQRPGVYLRSNNMRVSDLILAAGGLLPEAGGKGEIGRTKNGGVSYVIPVNLQDLRPGSPEDVVLEDRDVVTIPAVNPSLRAPEVVFIMGEVARPGPYVLKSRSERLVDLINRAGGLTESADARGLLFLRQKESLENSQQERDADLILQKSRAFADKQFLTHLAKLGIGLPGQFIQAVQAATEKLAKPTEVVPEEKLQKDITLFGAAGPESVPSPTESKPEQAGIEQPKAAAALIKEAEAERGQTPLGPKMAEVEEQALSGFKGRQELAALVNSTRISIDLSRALQDPSSADNIELRHGDQIFIPRVTNVVTVIGAVLHPHSFAVERGKSVAYCIQKCGGFAQDAAKSNVVVVRSNGDALPQDQVKSVEPGDMIVVPTTGLIDIAKKWERIGSVTKVLSEILSSAYILTRL
jgi:protein involved in polysaccharide export with SLBB domain